MGVKCEPCGHVMNGNPIMKDNENWMDCFPVIEEVTIDPLMSAMRKTDNWINRRMAYLADGLKRPKLSYPEQEVLIERSNSRELLNHGNIELRMTLLM